MLSDQVSTLKTSTPMSAAGTGYLAGEAQCFPGTVPTGGGVDFDRPNGFDQMIESHPTTRGWAALVYSRDGHAASVWAVCAKLK